MRFFTIASLDAALSVAGNTFASPITASDNHVVEKTANVDKRADPWYSPMSIPLLPLVLACDLISDQASSAFTFVRRPRRIPQACQLSGSSTALCTALSCTSESRLRSTGYWKDGVIIAAAKCHQYTCEKHGITGF